MKLNENTTFNAPLTNEAYSQVSDFNPIHVNPYFSDYASLPATITHGLWSSAATRRYVELSWHKAILNVFLRKLFSHLQQ